MSQIYCVSKYSDMTTEWQHLLRNLLVYRSSIYACICTQNIMVANIYVVAVWQTVCLCNVTGANALAILSGELSSACFCNEY